MDLVDGAAQRGLVAEDPLAARLEADGLVTSRRAEQKRGTRSFSFLELLAAQDLPQPKRGDA